MIFIYLNNVAEAHAKISTALDSNMKKVDVVNVDVLLYDFFKRAAKNENDDGQAVQNSVAKIIEDLMQNSDLRCALGHECVH